MDLNLFSHISGVLAIFGAIYYLKKKRYTQSELLPSFEKLNPHLPPAQFYIGSIDQGTSSSRFILFDENGKARYVSQKLFNTISPSDHPGWAEQDPFVLLNTVKECMAVVMNHSGVKREQIKAIGITNQRETALIWDKLSGEPLHPALVWHDTRTADVVKELVQTKGNGNIDFLREISGLPMSTYFSAGKWYWMIQNSERVRQKIAKQEALVGTVDSWLIWNLTDRVHVTDVSNASRTMLMDINTCKWSPQLLQTFNIDASTLPEIKSSSEVYGTIEQFELLRGVPIAGCLGDQQAALVGHKCFQPGEAKNTYGTGCFMLFNTGEKVVQSQKGLLTTVGYQLGPKQKPIYALEGAISAAGSALKWLQDLNVLDNVRETDRLASQGDPQSGVTFVPALSGLLAPYYNPAVRGTFLGLSLSTRPCDIVRSLLQAIALQTQTLLTAMHEESGSPLKQLRVDGGLTAASYLLQFSADILDLSVVKPDYQEATALGAALVAGHGVGVYQDVLQTEKEDQVKVYHPRMEEKQRLSLLKTWSRAVQMAIEWSKVDSQF